MKASTIVRTALLLFVAISIVFFVRGQFHRSTPPATPQAAIATVSASEAPVLDAGSVSPNTKVVAYYFHRHYRCVTCRKLEAVSHGAISDGFPADLERGDLVWRTLDVEDPLNEHFVSAYQLYASSVVLVRLKGGKQVEYKTLNKIWQLLENDNALKDYVQAEVRTYLRAS